MFSFINRIFDFIGKCNFWAKLTILCVAFGLIVASMFNIARKDEAIDIADEIIKMETGIDIKNEERKKKGA